MQLKQSTDYAISIVMYLAEKQQIANSEEISTQMCIPQSVVATLAMPLQKAGILTTLRGVGGGFALSRRPEDISLHEIINLIEGPPASTAAWSLRTPAPAMPPRSARSTSSIYRNRPNWTSRFKK